MHPEDQTKSKVWRRQSLSLLMASLCLGLSISLYQPLLPRISVELNLAGGMIWIVGSSYLSMVVFGLFAGRLYDRIGRLVTYLSLGIFALTMVGFALLPTTFLSLFILRVIQGAAFIVALTCITATFTKVIPKEGRGQAQAITWISLSVPIGLALLFNLGEVVYEQFSHQELFQVCALFGLIPLILVISIQLPTDSRQVQKERSRSSGKLSIWIALLSLPLLGFSICVALVNSYWEPFAAQVGIEWRAGFFTFMVLPMILICLLSQHVSRLEEKVGIYPILYSGMISAMLGFSLLIGAPSLYPVAGVLVGYAVGICKSKMQILVMKKEADPAKRGLVMGMTSLAWGSGAACGGLVGSIGEVTGYHILWILALGILVATGGWIRFYVAKSTRPTI